MLTTIFRCLSLFCLLALLPGFGCGGAKIKDYNEGVAVPSVPPSGGGGGTPEGFEVTSDDGGQAAGDAGASQPSSRSPRNTGSSEATQTAPTETADFD